MNDKPTGRAASSPADDEPIKVTDRRKFDRTGRLRKSSAAEQREAGHQAAPPPPNPPEPKRPEPGLRAGTGNQPHPSPGISSGSGDFQPFVYFLYISALHELGVPTDKEAPARSPDLERARFFIDFLQVLEQKTEGNLNSGESNLLKEVLYNLRMQYVDSAGKGASAAPGPASSATPDS
ncbi:MAG: DUF1844 domain-containing protein [Acidobacteriota bacterium]